MHFLIFSRATLLIDSEEEIKAGSTYLCELCDTTFLSKQAIALHKHRKHGLQLLIEANSLPHTSVLVSTKDKENATPVTNTEQAPKVQEPENHKKAPSITVPDVSDDEDLGGGGEPPSPLPPSPLPSPPPMDIDVEKPPTPEPESPVPVEKKTSKKKTVFVKEKSQSPRVAKKSTGGSTNFKPRRKSALRAERELKKLETNSSMRISDDELEVFASRKRHRSASSRASSISEFSAPRKAALTAEKKIKSATQQEERGSASEPENEPVSKRKCEVKEPEIEAPVEVKPNQPKEETSAASLSLDENSDLLDHKGRLECLFCFRVIHAGRYCAHMRNIHPNVDEFSWQIKPGQVDEIMTPLKQGDQETPKVKIEATSVSKDLSDQLNTSEKEALVCNVCDKSFGKRIALTQHYKKIHKLHYCCGETFDDDDAYQDHSVLHDLEGFDETTVETVDVDNSDETEAALAVFSAPLPPRSSKENVKPKEDASPQPATPQNRGRKPKNKAVTPVDRVFSCTKCICKGTENEVYDHYERIHSLYWCFTCKETFDKLGQLENHFNEQHITEYKEILDFYDRGDSDITSWKCVPCKKEFKNKSRLLQHYKMKHMLMPCFICTTPFKTQEQLQQHSELCEKKTCSYCSERFTQKILFLLHELQHIDDEDIDDFRPFKKDFYSFIMSNSNKRCTRCKLAFSTEQLYKRHVQKIHPDFDADETEEQGQSSNGKKSRNAAKPVKCDDCSREFSHPKYLQMHNCSAKEHASSDADDTTATFKCEICKQDFNSQTKLRNHLEVHASLEIDD